MHAAVEDSRDVRVIETGGQFHFPLEAKPGPLGAKAGGAHQLHRDSAFGGKLHRLPHHAHPAFAKAAEDLVAPQAWARRKANSDGAAVHVA